MTVNPSDGTQTENLNQPKIIPDTNMEQQQVDPNISQETEKQEDPNWKAFREARKKDRAEKEAAERKALEKEAEVQALKAAMEAAFAKNQSYQNTNYYNEPVEDETEDQRIEKKVQEALRKREEQYQRESLERERREYPQRLQKTYPDFNQTISQENLDYLDYHYPEVSRPLQRLQDGFEKWSDIYNAVKKFVPNLTGARADAARADMNQMKPKSMSSTHITQPQPVPGSHILSEERKAANWARMQQVRRGV